MNEPLPNTVNMVDVAEEVAIIETCPSVTACFAGDPGGIRRARSMNPFLGWQTVPLTSRVYRVRDRSLTILLKAGRAIAETNYLHSETVIVARVHPDRLVRLDSRDTVATCFDYWDTNYYHRMAHTAPTVHAILHRHSAGNIGLALPELRPWQRKSPELLGASNVPDFAVSGCLRTDGGRRADRHTTPSADLYRPQRPD